MTATTHERLTFDKEAERLNITRTALGAACIKLSLGDTLAALDAKRALELDYGVDATMTIHPVRPISTEDDPYPRVHELVAVFAPSGESEREIRDQAVSELQTRGDYTDYTVGNWAESYHANVFRGPSPSGIPEGGSVDAVPRAALIAQILTEASASIAA